MIISNIIGGLGNQMFQYAIGKSLAYKLGDTLKVDLTDFTKYNLHQGFELNKVFNCNIKVASNLEISKILTWQKYFFIRKIFSKSLFKNLRNKGFVVEPYYHYWQEINNLKGNLYLMGYWQSEKYFIKIKDIIRKDFIFKNLLSDKNKKVAHNISQVNSVSLHVRRGDYITNKKNYFIGTCDLHYYQKAIEFIKHKITNPFFFVFSDDISWAKKNLPTDLKIFFVDHNNYENSYYDMQLMSLCKHNIIANSTFSWWGAWLNSYFNKVVIAPKKWFADSTYNVEDLIPENWLRI